MYFLLVIQIIDLFLLQISLDIPLSDELDFSKCKQIHVKGINKAGVWSVISRDIKQCNVTVVDGKTEITPRIVIDAFGESGSFTFISLGNIKFIRTVFTYVHHIPYKQQFLFIFVQMSNIPLIKL